ncbi:MAG: SDR family NAD(P)-dependent oxidoreductase [Bacteroidetes bacterium]|nr:MAG: SDR family NAD(P)-dependent oxidoreductase [Bacteroidota bacterium]
MEEKNKDQFAVITGASQGLGKAFANELAKRKFNVVLVSLPGQNLSQLSDWISREFKVQSFYYETDFSVDSNIRALANWLNENFNVSILINNAGIGGTKQFEEAHIDYIDTIIQVNIKATALLTHQLLPNLKRQPQSFVLNVSSIAAFSPVGYKTVYPASKAFVHSFSRGLYAELKNTNVFVSVVNPGAIATNKEITSRIERQGVIGKLTLLQPAKVANYCITRLLRRDTVIMVNPLTWLLAALLPIWIKLPMMTQIIKREISYEKSICDRS